MVLGVLVADGVLRFTGGARGVCVVAYLYDLGL